MFRLRKPDEPFLEQLRECCGALPLSYAEVGCSRGRAPAGYLVDEYRVQLGSGAAVFERARQAVREWRMLQLGWVQPCWPNAPVKEGTLVGTMARVFGVWAVNVGRIVYVFDDEGAVARYGLAYGTLPGHMERGEERFAVEWEHGNESVSYSIRAISQPGRWFTHLGYPLTRRLQRRFGRDSIRVMLMAVK